MYCVVMDVTLEGAYDHFTIAPIYEKEEPCNETIIEVKQKHKYELPSDKSVHKIGAQFAVGDIVFYDQFMKDIKTPVYDASYERVLVNSMEIGDAFYGSNRRKKQIKVFGMKSGLYEIWVYSDNIHFRNIKEGQELLVDNAGSLSANVVRNFTIENGISQFVKKHYSKTI